MTSCLSRSRPPFLRAALAACPRVLLAGVLLAGLAGCASDDDLPPDNPFKAGPSERELRLEADGLYRLARRSLDTADFQGAVQRYDQILLKYPFTDYATQAQLESIYAKHRAFDPDGALSMADRFVKEHPRHPAIDYVYYMKGLINFSRGDALFSGLISSSGQDVSYARKAFDDFTLLLQRYPRSKFAHDARLRMVHLRNVIAEHELAIVKFYVRRGAHIAAAKRAEQIIAEFPGAPVTFEVMSLLEDSYRDMGLVAQADDVRHLRELNPPVKPTAEMQQRDAAPVLEEWFPSPPDPIPVPNEP
jgi:outer membrane protein assembly factor BamD